MHQQTPTDILHSLLSNLPSAGDVEYKDHFEQIKKAIADGANVNEWCSGDGTTPLQKIISKPKINIQVLRLLLEKGAKSYIPDAKYQLPAQVVGSRSKKQCVIELFKGRSVLDPDYLDQAIEFCLEFYIGEKNSYHEDNLLLDFATSLLTGENINPLLAKKETWMKYIAHLREIKQASLGEEIKFKLEGWQQKTFLATRIRALLEMIIELEFSEIPPPQMSLSEARKLLKKEILLEIETLHISQAIAIIKTFAPSDQLELAESLADNISKAMLTFLKEPQDEYCIPSGWATHALYINFIRLPDSNIMVRSDNLGSRPPQCHWPESKKFYPALLGTTQIAQLQQRKQKRYIRNLIMTKIAPYPPKTNKAGRAVERKKFFKAIYSDAIQELNLTELPKATILSTLQQLGYISSFSQKAGTCVVTNHNVGLRIRLKIEIFYQWVLEQEIARLGKIAYDSPADINHWWPQFHQPRQLSQRIIYDCKQHCQRQSTITFLFAESKLSNQGTIEFVIPDLLEKEFKENKWHINTISATTLYEKYLRSNLSLFVQGKAGMGKSTLCRYIASRWSAYQLWRDKFILVLYIPLRNLTPNRYPPQQVYQLLDVVKKECFSFKNIPSFEEKHLSKMLAGEQVLWLLDGYDELPPLSASLTAVIAEISKKPRLIITSRYPLPSSLMPKIYLETAGFDDESIIQYIDRFYKELSDESTQLNQFLEDHKVIKKTATIPINLEIICSIWQSNKTELKEAKILTTTHLYHIITLWLLRRFLLRENEFLTQPTRLVESSKLRNEYRVLRRLALEMQTLEHLAFRMMEDLFYQLPSEDFTALMPPPAVPDLEAFKTDVIDIGILVPSGGVKQELTDLKEVKEEKERKIQLTEYKESGSYEFIHASFQEFFTARYLVAGLYCRTDSSDHRQAITFIINRRYNSLAVMEFTAGLLSGNRAEGKEARQSFWRALQQPPYDVTQLNQVNLLISCLQQALAGDPLQTIDNSIVNYINKTLLSIFQHPDKTVIENFNFKKLSRTLRNSYKIIASPELGEACIIALAYISNGIDSVITRADLLAGADIASQRLIIETAQRLLFIKNRTIDFYIVTILKSHPETVIQIYHRLLKEASDLSGQYRSVAIWLLGCLDIGHLRLRLGPGHPDYGCEKLIETLKSGLVSENPNVRFQSVHSLNALLIYDDDIFQQLEQMIKHDQSEKIRTAAAKTRNRLGGWKDHCEEEPDGYNSPQDDYAEYLDEQEFEAAKADDEKTHSRHEILDFLDDDFRQSLADRWVTAEHDTQKCRLKDQEKKSEEQELKKREIKDRQHSLSIKNAKGEDIKIGLNEKVYRKYRWLQQGERNLSEELILEFDDLALQFLIEKKLYLPNTEFIFILTAYKNTNNNLLADLAIKHAFEKGITLVVTKNGFCIYKQQNEKRIELSTAPAIIINFIKRFNVLAKQLGLQPLPALFDSPYSPELQTLFAEYERLREIKNNPHAKTEALLERVRHSIRQALIGIYPIDNPAAQELLTKRLSELAKISALTEAQQLEKNILEEIKPKIKAAAEEKQELPPDPPADHHSMPALQNKAIESALFDSFDTIRQPSKKRIKISQSGHSFLVTTEESPVSGVLSDIQNKPQVS